MRIVRLILLLIKGIYDILASYLLAWIVFFALLAWGFHGLLTLAVEAQGFESAESFWSWADKELPLRALTLRLLGFGLLHAIFLVTFRRRVLWLKGRLERATDAVLKRYRAWAREGGRAQLLAGGVFSLVVTLLLVPFVVQPTLVPLRWGAGAWVQRAANLVDGSATAALAESVIGLYRKLYAEPVVAQGVTEEEFETSVKHPLPTTRAPAGRRPLMDRWDPVILRTVKGDRRAFALLKALIFVESGGMQFAVSRTGCLGLTQFCTRTARTGGFRKIFGVGQVYPCRCRGPCTVSRAAKRDLESGDPRRIVSRKAEFPCDMTDARFNPDKAIRAGHAFAGRLYRRYGGNIYLVYIGYNSGPAVSDKLWRALGQDSAADLQTIERHLPGALRRYFRKASEARARSLVKVHLPKIKRAFDAFYRPPRKS